MTELRWILIACGAALLAGIYFWGRRGPSGTSIDQVRARPDPRLAPVSDSFHEEPETVESESDAYTDDEHLARRNEEIVGSRYPEGSSTAMQNAATSGNVFESRRGRVEPTFNAVDFDVSPAKAHAAMDEEETALTAELPASDSTPAPTLSMSTAPAPAPRRIERRKIVSLRLAASAQRFPGEQLLQALQAGSLHHGKYDVFHRLHGDGDSIFCVASMVEPGTFDLGRMAAQNFSGITLFAQLPGPIPGVHALHELVTCGKQLQEDLGGTLQDDRGVPLTVHRVDKLRQEVVDFERNYARESAQRSSPPPSL